MDSTNACHLPHDLSHYFKELSHCPEYAKKFGVYTFKTRSVLKNLTDDIDPCHVLEKYIQSLVENAVEKVRQNGHSPYWFGVAFCTEGGKERLVNWKPDDANPAGRVTEELKNFHRHAHCLKLYKKPVNIRVTIVADPRDILK